MPSASPVSDGLPFFVPDFPGNGLDAVLIGLSLVGSPLLPDSLGDEELSDFWPDSLLAEDGDEEGDELGDGIFGPGVPGIPGGLGEEGIGELLPGTPGIGELLPPELLLHPARPVLAASNTTARARIPGASG